MAYPDPENPGGQSEQLRPPCVLMQVASGLQPPLLPSWHCGRERQGTEGLRSDPHSITNTMTHLVYVCAWRRPTQRSEAGNARARSHRRRTRLSRERAKGQKSISEQAQANTPNTDRRRRSRWAELAPRGQRGAGSGRVVRSAVAAVRAACETRDQPK